jgi:diamine N-acetyltransferase
MSIQVRPSKAEDLTWVIDLENRPENAKFVMPWSSERHADSLSDQDIFHGVITRDGNKVGYVILAGLTNPNRSIEFMRVVVADKGKGTGRQVLRWAKGYAFDELGAHRLWLDVKTFNDRAKALYLSEGFQVEGTLRECVKTDGIYESLTILSILENER